jgi:hypothetical protein
MKPSPPPINKNGRRSSKYIFCVKMVTLAKINPKKPIPNDINPIRGSS